MAPSPILSALAALLTLAGCSDGPELPPEIARSKYVVYHTDVDASMVCMDDLLAREDRFIERTATRLGVDPPADPIHFVWDPDQSDSAPWLCDAARNCHRYFVEEELSIIVSETPTQHHELVHAIDAQALGTDVHRTLVEGLAEYLGSLQTSVFGADDFPAAFKAMLEASPVPSDYRLAMHFVGSVFALDGAEKYKELRATVPMEASDGEFAAAFEAVYGRAFDDALEQMSREQVYAVGEFAGCDEAPELSWTGPEVLETTVAGECGDPWFYGAGLIKGRSGFSGYYLVDVPQAGEYQLTVDAVAGAPTPLRGLLLPCSFDLLGSGVASRNGDTGIGQLKAGKHTLFIGFPARSEARGDAAVRLEYIGPSPQP